MAQLNLQRLDTSLATKGLGTFDLPTVEEDKLGSENQIVTEACDILKQRAGRLEELKEDLETAKASLLDGEWTGQAADDFATAFPKMISAFEEIAPCINSLANWAESTMEAYDAVDSAAANRMNNILGL